MPIVQSMNGNQNKHKVTASLTQCFFFAFSDQPCIWILFYYIEFCPVSVSFWHFMVLTLPTIVENIIIISAFINLFNKNSVSMELSKLSKQLS